MFDPVDPKQSFPDLEKGILQYWQEEDIFKRSVKHRASTPLDKLGIAQHDNVFSFYDGPPFATGLPHYGHLLAGTIKDVIPRYQTMRGKRVDRRFGWDCHGLPVENLVEQEEGLKSKRDIEERGVRWFNDKCRSSVQRYTREWKKTVERTGRWVDMDYDYRTMDPDYMESIWWVFKSLYDKGLIYEGRKSMHVCPRCVTPLSNFEVTLGYKDVPDWTTTSIFPLVGDPKTALLAWTTTSWTLPGNLFLAVGENIIYARVKVQGDERTYIMAEKLIPTVFKDQEYEILGTLTAKDLIGKKYEPLFPYFAEEYKKQNAFRVVPGDFVTTEDGTGIVHIATGFGDDDYQVGKREGVETLSHVGMDGKFIDQVTDFAGQEVKPLDDPTKTDKKIAAWLKDHGRLFAEHSYKHSYPHCWRCDSPLINYAASSWFVAVDTIKKDLLTANAKTSWVPAHIRDGRFGNWLENARDWAISRNRFWGTPLPIWRNENGAIEVIGSRDELMAKCPLRFTKVTALRHAESEGNLVPIYQGVVPGTDLTKLGTSQAKATGKKLRKKSVKKIYCSPLARTCQTAEIIAKYAKAEIIVDERLREVSFGDYEGQTVDFSDLTFVKQRRAHKIEKGKPESIYHFDGMETWDNVQLRIKEFMDEVLPKHKGEHIVVVSHADPIVNIKHFFTQEEPYKLSHQPYPEKAKPYTFFFDHERSAQMDLHKDTVDGLVWGAGSGDKGEVFRRIPDVLDCWFESGSMPYAQAHFPFENETKHPPGFPADFIAEGLDQTRGWFYTLMVLSSALFKKPAFQNCIVNGIVLAEDGKKMSKRLKNYPEPNAIMEQFGADAMRFTLMASPAVRGENLRFSEKAVEETVRRVMLPLWNVYSFFVLHANEAGWPSPDSLSLKEATQTPEKSIAMRERGEPRLSGAGGEGHPLDLWIRAEAQDLTNRMTHELDSYDLSATCSELYDTLDALTNWYIRRSRRRFAGKEGDAERTAALATLYEVLTTFCTLLAPICPFITEAIYLNTCAEEHGSIHFSDWPAVRSLAKEEDALMKKTRLLRTIVSLGLGLRAEANVKVRQPLAEAQIALPSHAPELDATDQKVVCEELNVKHLTFLEDATNLASRVVQVNARVAGPRLGGKVQEIIKAAKEGKFEEDEKGRITILGEKMKEEEVQIVYQGKEGQQVACEKGIVVSLSTEITDDLKLEGLARDAIRSIQSLRKDAGLTVSDRVALVAGEGMDALLPQYQQLIEAETNGSFGSESAKIQIRLHIADGNVQADL